MVFYMIMLLVNVKKKKIRISSGSSIAVHISLKINVTISGISMAFYELFYNPWKLVKSWDFSSMSDSDKLMAFIQCPSIFSEPFLF